LCENDSHEHLDDACRDRRHRVSTTALLLTACGSSGGDEAAASGDGVQVEAAFYPLQWAAERVGGDRVGVASLTPPGAEPHDLELTPQDVASLSEADLVVYLRGFQAAVDEAVAEAGDAAWDAGQAADLSLTTTEEHSHEGETEEEHAAHEGEEEHAEEGGEVTDPHFWLDPTRLADVGDALAQRLAEADPDGAGRLRENAAALRGRPRGAWTPRCRRGSRLRGDHAGHEPRRPSATSPTATVSRWSASAGLSPSRSRPPTQLAGDPRLVRSAG
jgi:hypothetical protein